MKTGGQWQRNTEQRNWEEDIPVTDQIGQRCP